MLSKDPTPLYFRIKQQIKQQIEQGQLAPGQPLPSERELCEQFGVSRPTVRQATQELLNEGLLERRRGIGTYIAQPKIRHRLASVLGFSERMQRDGRKPSSRLIEQRVLPAGDAGDSVVEQLDVEPDAAVVRIQRVRYADDEPIFLETVHLPLARFPGIDTVDFGSESLYRVLRERYDVTIFRISETLEPVLPDQASALALDSSPDRPAMLAGITTYDQHGQPVEHTFSLVRGDRCQYYIEFHVGEERGNSRAHLRQNQLEISF